MARDARVILKGEARDNPHHTAHAANIHLKEQHTCDSHTVCVLCVHIYVERARDLYIAETG